MLYFIGALLILLIAEAIRSTLCLRVTPEEIVLDNLPSELDGFKIIHLSDLHNHSFGRNNQRLVHYIRHNHPDLILCSGDMAQSHKGGIRAFYHMLRQLNGRYPIFYSFGNHELLIKPGDRQTHIRQCEKLGAIVLNNELITLERRKVQFVIGGYCAELKRKRIYNHGHALMESASAENMTEKLGKKPDGQFILLIAHNPDDFPVYADWGADLTLSGHLHGGLWRPFGVGMLSPTRRFFPEFSEGLYRYGHSAMYVSAGLSGSILPRMFNRPQIAVLTLRTQQGKESKEEKG